MIYWNVENAVGVDGVRVKWKALPVFPPWIVMRAKNKLNQSVSANLHGRRRRRLRPMSAFIIISSRRSIISGSTPTTNKHYHQPRRVYHSILGSAPLPNPTHPARSTTWYPHWTKATIHHRGVGGGRQELAGWSGGISSKAHVKLICQYKSPTKDNNIDNISEVCLQK